MSNSSKTYHATTVLCMRHNGKTIMMADGQVTFGDMAVKLNAKKIRKISSNGDVLLGFAGSVIDCLVLAEMIEKKLSEFSGQLVRSLIEVAKDWRKDRSLRELNAHMMVADKNNILTIDGSGLVIEVENHYESIGSGSVFAASSMKTLNAISSVTDQFKVDLIQSFIEGKLPLANCRLSVASKSVNDVFTSAQLKNDTDLMYLIASGYVSMCVAAETCIHTNYNFTLDCLV